MPALKHSRQRESIKQFLASRRDHPTADMVYASVRREFPHISLGTVYRNLSLLTELGEIAKISSDGPDRFDANQEPHYHFVCRNCHAVLDMKLPVSHQLEAQAGAAFPGRIEGHSATFYGLCPRCLGDSEGAPRQSESEITG